MFTNFDVLTVTGGTVTQTDALRLGEITGETDATGEIGEATFSGGTYTINMGRVLQARNFTVSGGTLAGAGTARGTDEADSFTLSSGTLSVDVNLSMGADTFTWSGGTVSW